MSTNASGYSAYPKLAFASALSLMITMSVFTLPDLPVVSRYLHLFLDSRWVIRSEKTHVLKISVCRDLLVHYY